MGRVREHNEDSFGIDKENNLFFVCDGMGGHAAGDYASQRAVESISELSAKNLPEFEKIIIKDNLGLTYNARKLVSLAMLANRWLFRLALMYPKLRGMGTTFTSLKFEDGFVNIVNVGDSRIYRLRNGNIEQITLDHTWMEELIQDGELRKKDASAFGKKNVITRAIGTSPSVKVDWKASQTQPGDLYLLCSDGLCGEISDNEIQNILKRNFNDLKKAVTELITAANNAGGSDNITVIVAKVVDPGTMTASGFIMDKIVGFLADDKYQKMMDAFIDKKFPPEKTVVPAGVARNKKKIYQDSGMIAIIAVLVLTGLIIAAKKPWDKTNAYEAAPAIKGDILIRTIPSAAEVSVYLEENLLERKESPADFLALEEGTYRIEVNKYGYEKKSVYVIAKKGEQALESVQLNELLKLEISLGVSPGFNTESYIYIDGNPAEYYGSTLTVQRVGLVGKTFSLSRNTTHYIRVENAEKHIYADNDAKLLKVQLNQKKIIMEK